MQLGPEIVSLSSLLPHHHSRDWPVALPAKDKPCCLSRGLGEDTAERGSRAEGSFKEVGEGWRPCQACCAHVCRLALTKDTSSHALLPRLHRGSTFPQTVALGSGQGTCGVLRTQRAGLLPGMAGSMLPKTASWLCLRGPLPRLPPGRGPCGQRSASLSGPGCLGSHAITMATQRGIPGDGT